MPRKRAFLFVGREQELARLEENIKKRRHTLLTGKIGIGKSHLLRYIERKLKRSIYIERINPLKTTMLEILKHLHQNRYLKVEGIEVEYLDWDDLTKKLNRLTTVSLAELVITNLKTKKYILLLDQLETLTPTMTKTIETLMANALVIGATSNLKESLNKIWWSFDRVEITQLTKDESKELLWQIADREKIQHPQMFENKVLTQANGNPYAILEMAKQTLSEDHITPDFIRDLGHQAGIRLLDITPILLFVGAFIIAARFVALGLNDQDLYIVAGASGAFFLVFRFFLYRMMRK